MKYRNKPEPPFDAWRVPDDPWDTQQLVPWVAEAFADGRISRFSDTDMLLISGANGPRIARSGDYVVDRGGGNYGVLPADIFEARYEPVPEWEVMAHAIDSGTASTRPPLAHDYRDAEPSRSGKRGWRCAACGYYTNAPVKTELNPCPGKPKEDK